LVALVVVVMALGTWTFPRVPDVRGLTEQETQRELEDAGFDVAIAQFPPPYGDWVQCFKSSDVVGIAIGQDPCSGTLSRQRRGSLVVVWIRMPDTVCNAPPGFGCA